MRRVELGLSRRQLAERAGLSHPYIADIERGSRRPSTAALRKVAAALGLTTVDLLARADTLVTLAALDRSGGRDPASGSAPAGDVSDPLAGLVRQVHQRLREELEQEVRETVRRELLERRPPTSFVQPAALDAEGVRATAVEVASSLAGEDEQTEVDPDGDVSVRSGEVMLYIRVLDEPAGVLVFSPMLVDVPATTAALERINELNIELHFVRICLTRGTVVVDLELFGDWFHPDLLKLACEVVVEVSADLAPQLQAQIGGRLYFGEELPPRRDTGGYL